jgi:large repetitive protein
VAYMRNSFLENHVEAEAKNLLPQSCLGRLLTLTIVLLMAADAQAQSVFSAWQNVGTTSAAQNVTVTATVTGTVSKVEVLTMGVSGLDFAKGSGSSTCESASVIAGNTCQESVTFTPSYPGVRLGAVVLLDVSNNVLGTAYISGTGQGGLAVLTPGNVITVAGVVKEAGGPQNGIPSTQAELKQPASVVLDGAGNMYIADSANNEIRMVCFSATSATIRGVTCPGAGIIIDIAGTGAPGYAGDGGLASAANVTLDAPSGLGLDGAGNLYIADTNNNVIREIDAATGFITTVAGDGTAGYGGDGSNATASGVELNSPWGVTPDAAGNLYIADTANQRIRRVDAVSGIITTAAGNGDPSGLGDGKGTYSGDAGKAILAGLSLPYAVAFDTYGNMLIPDSANNRIRAVTAVSGAITAASVISTIAGTGSAGSSCANGQTNATALNSPEGVALDAAGNLYISDTGDECIRKANLTNGEIVQLAQSGDTAISLAGIPGQAEVFEPVGIAVDGFGNVYYADYYFMVIDEIQSNKAALDFRATAVRQGSQSTSPLPQTVENDGNAALVLDAITPVSNAAVDAPSTTCMGGNGLSQDEDCTVGAIFAPSSAGNPLLGDIDVTSNTLNTPLDIVLIGDATAVNSTDTTLTSAPNPSEVGKIVTLTATVTTGAGTGSLTGTVTFSDTFNGNTVQLGAPITVNASGVAVLTTGSLAVGVHSLSASYNGDSTHFATTTPATSSQTVFEDTQTVLTALPASPSPLGGSVTFKATVSVTDGGTFPLDGSVTFTDSVATFTANTVTISGGVATFTTSALVQGLNAITATYTPNTTNLIQGSVGNETQIVQSASGLSLTSNPNPSIYGTPVTQTVTIPTVGAAAATGNVAISIVPAGQTTPVATETVTLAGNPAAGAASISTLNVGTYTITATYPGDTNYAQATSSSIGQTVTAAQTATAIVAAPNPGVAGKAGTLTATVTAAQGTITPQGTVKFTDTFNGTTVALGTAGLASNGTASINPVLAAGLHSIVAAYEGNSNDSSSSVTLALTVNQAVTTTTVTPTPNPAIVDQTVTFTASVTGTGGMPTGSVNFLANGSIVLGTANLNGSGTAQVTNATLIPGSYQITAVYAGDTNDSGSTSAAVTEVVGTIPTTTNLSTAATTGANSQTILVANVQDSGAASVIPSGTVTFTNGTTLIGSATLNANGVATLTPELGSGSYNIVAAYSGDPLHSPSTSTAIPVTSAGSTFNIGVTPVSVTMATSQNATVTVNVNSISGFTDTITLGCAGLPAGVNCHFSNLSVNLPANGTVTAQLTIDTNNPLGGGSSAMNRRPGKRDTELAGLFLPFGLFLGWTVWKFRKRHAGVLSTALVLVLTGAALVATGCGGFTLHTAAPGTYVIQVAGVGTNSNVTQYQAVTLTITK